MHTHPCDYINSLVLSVTQTSSFILLKRTINTNRMRKMPCSKDLNHERVHKVFFAFLSHLEPWHISTKRRSLVKKVHTQSTVSQHNSEVRWKWWSSYCAKVFRGSRGRGGRRILRRRRRRLRGDGPSYLDGGVEWVCLCLVWDPDRSKSSSFRAECAQQHNVHICLPSFVVLPLPLRGAPFRPAEGKARQHRNQSRWTRECARHCRRRRLSPQVWYVACVEWINKAMEMCAICV